MARSLKSNTVEKDKPINKTKTPAVKSKAIKNVHADEIRTYFEKIFNDSSLGIMVVDSSGMIIKVNRAFQKMLGYSEKELLSMCFSDITHPHDNKTDQKLFKEFLSGKRNQYSLSKRYITKSGHIIYGKTTQYGIKDTHSKNKLALTLVEDITFYKKMMNDLSHNQYLFNALLDSIQDSIYFKDSESRFIKVNKKKAQNHNISDPAVFIGKTDFDFFSKGHATEAYNDEQEIIKTTNPIIDKEEKLSWPDGRTAWVTTSKFPFFDERGKIIGTIGITHDITNRKKTEELLQNERILMRTVFDHLPDAIYAKDLECRKTLVNKSDLKNLKCVREEEAVGKTDFDFFTKEVAEGFYADDLAVLQTGQPVINREEFFFDTNNHERWLLTSKLPLRNEENKITGLVGIGHDITIRKKSEKIREALYQISEAANTASDMLTLYKRIHEIIQTLVSAKNLYIALYDEKSEMLSFPYFVDEFDPPLPSKKLGKGLTEYVLRTKEAILVDAKKDYELRKSGEVELIGTPQAIWLGVPLKLSGKAIGVIVVQDYKNEKVFGESEMQLLTFVSEQIAQVIERKRSSDAIKQYAEGLKLSNQTKDKFFSIIAHDLKNPFITIMGFSDLLLSDYKELSEEEKLFYIEEMKKSAELSHALLQNLLQWSRSQTGKIEFNPQKINVSELINENIELLKANAIRKQINIIYGLSETNYVFADEDMVNTILRNLFTNALKFTKKDGIIKVETDFKDGFCEIRIIDNGVGMDENMRDCIFRLDVNHSIPGTENETGSGLGLVLCKEFIEKNGGKIWVNSKPGLGSEFCFTLPAIKQ
jgi:PAS domain S-box-containing protein